MKKFLLSVFLLGGISTFAQNDDCSYSVPSEETAIGGNITTGGTYEYSNATDFDVEKGTIFNLNQVKLHLFKGPANLEYVVIRFWTEFEGMPGEIIHSFTDLIPISENFAYTSGIENMDVYQIVVNIPETEFTSGKYFMEVQAAPGDDVPVSWEIANEISTSVGRFDISKFDSDPWFSGFSYYDQVVDIIGTCSETSDEQPDYGDECTQGNPTNNHETGFANTNMSVADDFIVAENTTFYISDFKISTLQLGGFKNANIKIRKSENNQPGEIIYEVNKKGPKTENFFGYWPLEGYPLDVVAVDVEFEFDEPIELVAGEYFLEIKANPVPFSDILIWEATTEPSIGGPAMLTFDGGETWEAAAGYNMVFDVNGYCRENLAVNDGGILDFSFYPNPVNDELNIVSNSDVKNISITNVSGQKVININSNSKKINTSTLTSGTYFVKVTLSNGQIETFKIIKK